MVSHANIGAIFCLPILLLTITGVILVYPQESKVVLLESLGADGQAIVENTIFDASDGLPTWSTAIEMAKNKFPESRIRSVQPSSIKSNRKSVNLQQKEGWHRLGRSSLTSHANGELTIQDELAQLRAKRVFGFSYPLHTAKLGLVYRIFITLVGLGFAFLSLLGLISYLKRNT
ncbi:MAG: PepSY domain-containing protein [Arenicella sp.]|nr:PepSY domain-containing protein [Arenicella sp.]